MAKLDWTKNVAPKRRTKWDRTQNHISLDFRNDTALLDWLEKQARVVGCSRSEIIRACIRTVKGADV